MKRLLLAAVAALTLALPARAETLKLAVTTSFSNSGLAEILLPEIKKDLGLEVQLLVVGTGQALQLGAMGDVDAVLSHAKAAEEKWIADGHGTHRREIMYNDFLIIGPINDPAKVTNTTSAANSLKAIAAAKAPFVSRGDDSGTHKTELALWKSAGITPGGDWYKAVGQSMGAALNMAASMDAYILADRATWLKFANKGNLALLLSGDVALFNQYAFLPVAASKGAHIKAAATARLEAWLVSDRAKTLIEGYQIEGQQLFFWNAR